MAVTDRMELKTQKKEAALTVNELLYLIFFSVMLFSKGMGWYDGMRPYQLCLLIGMGCLGLKLILTKYTPWQLLVAAVFGVLGVLSWRCSAEKGMLTCVMMLIYDLPPMHRCQPISRIVVHPCKTELAPLQYLMRIV